MTLAQLTENIRCSIYVDADCQVLELSIDSKKKTNRGLYFCIEGTKVDGHDFYKEAVENGAVALVVSKKFVESNSGAQVPSSNLALADKQNTGLFSVPYILVDNVREALGYIAANFYDNVHKKLSIVAITGTNGKTTTSYITKSILEFAGKSVGVIGSNGATYTENVEVEAKAEAKKQAEATAEAGAEAKNQAEPQEKFIPLDLTTPDPIELHKVLKQMYVSGVRYVVMEASAHAIALDKLAGMKFINGVFTNLSQDHLDFFGDMQNYASAKKKLFDYKMIRRAIVNIDDEIGREIAKSAKVPILTFGSEAESIVRGSEYVSGVTNSFVLTIGADVREVTLNLSGKFNMYNALAAASVAHSLSINIDTIAQGITRVQSVAGRFNVVSSGGKNVVIDFAHTPEGMDNLLRAVREIYKGRVICVFGAGGNRDKAKRPKMGAVASRLADFSFLTADNPRDESVYEIISEIASGFDLDCKYRVVSNRSEAIKQALALSNGLDVVVIAGKGAEDYIEIKGVKTPYNDMEEVEKILNIEQ